MKFQVQRAHQVCGRELGIGSQMEVDIVVHGSICLTEDPASRQHGHNVMLITFVGHVIF